MQYTNGSYQSEPSNSKVIADPQSPAAISLASGAKVASGAGSAFAIENANAVVITVIVTGVSGTSPTLVINFQSAATFGGGYSTEASSASITANGTYTFLSKVSNPFYKASWTIGGTTPNFVIDVKATPFLYGVNP